MKSLFRLLLLQIFLAGLLTACKDDDSIGASTDNPSTGTPIDLGLSVRWADINVGATKPEEFGWYVAWGETRPKDNYNWSTYKYCNGKQTNLTKYCTNPDYGTVDGRTKLEPSDDVATIQWGQPWRIPTLSEMDELVTQCTWTWTTLNDVSGYRVTGPNGNSIFLPTAGYRYDKRTGGVGTFAGYWTSECEEQDPYDAARLYFDVGGYEVIGYNRWSGRNVRPVSSATGGFN